MDSLYSENHILGRLFRKFMDLFPQAIKPTKKLLALFLIGQLCTEHFTSVRNLHKTFLSSVCDKKLNSYYHALSNDKIANTQIRQMLAKMSLGWLYNPTLPRRKCSKPCDTWPRACFFENNYIPTVYSFISVLIFRKSPLV